MKPNRRIEQLSIRVTQTEKRWIENQARIAKLTVSDLVHLWIDEKQAAQLVRKAGFKT